MENSYSLDAESGSESLRPRPETWAASPLNPYENDEVKEIQRHVYEALEDRTEEACRSQVHLMPAELQDILRVTAVQNFHRESSRNYESYCNTPKPIIAHSYLRDAETNARLGRATCGELLDLRQDMQMASVEIAKLSHIGGILIEQLPIMRQAVDRSILERNGHLTDSETENGRLFVVNTDSMIFYNDKVRVPTNALVMKRKRTLGDLPDGTIIKERSRFIVSVENLPHDLRAAVRNVPILPKEGQGDTYKWLNDSYLGNISELQEKIWDCLEQNDYETVIPVSTTAYAYNPETERNNITIELERTKARRAAAASKMGAIYRNPSVQLF